MKKILMIVGSTRVGSFNQQLAEYIAHKLEGKAEVSFLAYDDIPFMNQDIEFPTPEVIARVREDVMTADGLWVVTPEYNGYPPALIKNLFDWLSRPLVENKPAEGKASKGAKVTFCGIGGSRKTASSRTHLATIAKSIGMEVVGGDGIGLGFDAKTFVTGLVSFTPEFEKELDEQMDLFLSVI